MQLEMKQSETRQDSTVEAINCNQPQKKKKKKKKRNQINVFAPSVHLIHFESKKRRWQR